MTQSGLTISYNVKTSFNSLLGVEVCGRLLFEEILEMDGIIRLPKDINRDLFSSLIRKVSQLHEEHEIHLNKSEVVLFYIALNISSIFFENKTFDDAKLLLPMLDHANENKYFHIQKDFLKFADSLIRFINDNFAADTQFRQALESLCKWKITKTIIVTDTYKLGTA